MRHKISAFTDTMALMVVLWLCSLPLIGFIILPLFGRPVAIATALTLLPLLLVVCWGICGWPLVRKHKEQLTGEDNE